MGPSRATLTKFYLAVCLQKHCTIHSSCRLGLYNQGSPLQNATAMPSDKVSKRRNDLLASCKAKVMAATVPRIEKIEVQYHGRNIADDATLLMNRGLSTPYQCALHMSQTLAKDSIVALVKKSEQGKQESTTIVGSNEEKGTIGTNSLALTTSDHDSSWIPWDIHRPLEYNCELKLLKFQMDFASKSETFVVNEAYWRSCAMVLGAVAQQAFEDDAGVKLAFLPDIDINSGAFCYDIELSEKLLEHDGTPKWKPDEMTLIKLTKIARQIIKQQYNFERVEAHKEDAANIFQDDEYMLARLENTFTSTSSPSHVPIYRFGEYLDINDGPMIPSTALLYHFVVTGIHYLHDGKNNSRLWRIQGLSLPKQLQVHHAIWAMLEHRARSLVKQKLPFTVHNHHSFDTPMHKYRSIENETKRYNLATGQWLQDKWLTTEEKIKVRP